MAVLIVSFTSWMVFRGIGALGVVALAAWQRSACYALAVMFIFTGIAHFNKLKYDLARMVPGMFSRPMLLVYFTGVLEFAGAAGLMLPRFRSLGGICLIVLLIVMSRQCERGDEGNDGGWQASHSPRVEGSDAGIVYRAFVVVYASIKNWERCGRIIAVRRTGFLVLPQLSLTSFSGLCRFLFFTP